MTCSYCGKKILIPSTEKDLRNLCEVCREKRSYRGDACLRMR